jgi:Cu/Ag efflux protein CusF
MNPLYLTPALGLAMLLAACGEKPASDAAAPANTAKADAPGGMDAMSGNMAMPAEAKTGKGTGTVTALDKAAGKITLDHGPIPELGWPAMTMAFTAKPELLGGVAVGDEIAFDLTVRDNAGEVTAITRQ